VGLVRMFGDVGRAASSLLHIVGKLYVDPYSLTIDRVVRVACFLTFVHNACSNLRPPHHATPGITSIR
jgi:hypothetical protein